MGKWIRDSGGSDGKETACSSAYPGYIPGSRRSPGEGNGNPLQYSCPENSMDRGAWWVTVHGVTVIHGVAKSQTLTELQNHHHHNTVKI